MRNAFIQELFEIAGKDPEIWLLTGDLGFGVLEKFADTYPSRFVNMGVAEQNMTGVAAGLARDKRKVFTYSIANFSTFRCLEQIRNDVCYHNANVKIVSVGAGVAYGTHGYTHYGVEDIAIMRCLPNMKILSPADPVEARLCARLACASTGPMYIRLGKNGESNIHNSAPDFESKSCLELKQQIDGAISIMSTGSITSHALGAAIELQKKGIDTSCYSVFSPVPFDIDQLRSISQRSRLIVSVEEHSAVGGLGSLIAENLCKIRSLCPLLSLSLPALLDVAGDQEYLLKRCGLNTEGIKDSILKFLAFN